MHISETLDYSKIPPSLLSSTPFFIIDLSKVEAAYKNLVAVLPNCKIYYALKANSETSVINHLKHLGANFEIASANEGRLLVELGVKPHRILYSNPVKSWRHIQEVFVMGVSEFAFDAMSELDKLAAYAPGSSVYLRFSVDDHDSIFPLGKKFGARYEDIVTLALAAKERKLHFTGIAFHVGSQCLQPDRWEAALKLAGDAMRELRQHGIMLKTLNIGGGFPANYGGRVPQLASIAEIINQGVQKYLPYPVELVAEPGRCVVAEAGTLVTSVIGRESRHGRNWLYLDAGALNGMLETLETNNTLHYPITTSVPAASGAQTAQFVLTGPTCDPQDTLFYNVTLPTTIDINDLVYIHHAGAYTIEYACRFNGFEPPKAYCL